MKLAGEKALLTGSDQGIGQAIAIRLGQEGADIAINYRKNRDGAQETAARIESLGHRVALIQADVSAVADAQRVVADAIATLGGLDVLVNNAGTRKTPRFLTSPRLITAP